ncbi:transcriptional regulator [Streptomyces puniciscabiei]|uniref:Transcriptional regulator n=1 Tax=Streptomyces puniciscabiei TaxID=164348 RepID=A0A542UH71_9ACTN|nr:transcriptional regulator [Streptomyces puniciscabiei]TQK98416.1 transcriptional regulator [Streptomyces puniciscabiei]
MSGPRFDEVIHPAHRLQICALLAGVEALEFAVVRDTLGVSDSVLSKQVKALQAAQYVEIRKVPLNARTHTWLALTPSGRTALKGHLAELRRVAALAGPI